MGIVDLRSGDWFEHGGERFIKVNPFSRMNRTYYAVSLVDGRPAFLAKTSTVDHPSLSEVEVVPITKPSWAQERVAHPA